jgi:hypothetical protein
VPLHALQDAIQHLDRLYDVRPFVEHDTLDQTAKIFSNLPNYIILDLNSSRGRAV